ncbi:hypothetical protein HK405_010558, partial [Cladochytrium tenue]
SIGNPFEAYKIGGRSFARYQIAWGIFGMYVGGYFLYSLSSRMSPKKPVGFSSPEEEDFVKRYIAHVKSEAHKPLLVRDPYTGPSGLN